MRADPTANKHVDIRALRWLCGRLFNGFEVLGGECEYGVETAG